MNGDSDELWIKDYHVRVSTKALVLEDEKPSDKKICVSLDEIDGDRAVCTYVNKKFIQKVA